MHTHPAVLEAAYSQAEGIDLFVLAMDNGELPRGNSQLQVLLFYSGVLTVSHAIAKDLSRQADAETMFQETKRQLFYGLLSEDKEL